MNKCQCCNKETANPKYCSKSCAAKINNKLIPKRATKKKCIVCNDKVKSFKHNRCEKHWQEYLDSKPQAMLDRTLKHYFTKPSLKNLHPSSKSVHIRLQARLLHKELLTKPCANCKYNKHVELCHIKPIRAFDDTATLGEVNSIKNIIQLCPNCHWELDHNIITIEQIRTPGGDRTHINPITVTGLEDQAGTGV